MPDAFAALKAVMERLERHYRDMQDVEFTVQRGTLWILQTRAGKRTAKAALKIAVDMAGAGLLSEAEALTRVDPLALEQLLHPTLDPDAPRRVLARGLPASPGAACGKAVFDPDEAEDRAARGEAVILLRTETSPEDIHGMHAARGIVTSRGGMTSHAAVVARGMGRPCITGAAELRIDEAARQCRAGGTTIAAGDVVTIDGTSGELLEGAVSDDPARALRRLHDPHGMGGPRAAAAGSAPTPRRRAMPRRRSASAPKASGFAAPSTCSSTTRASSPCAR